LPSDLAYYQNSAGGTLLFRFSPKIAESEHGGFNLNAVFSLVAPDSDHGGTVYLNQPYTCSPAL
jgi:hypothetical protein